MKYLLSLIVLVSSFSSFAQVDTVYLKALYDRCLDFSEDKADSIDYYASFIEEHAQQLDFAKADVLSLRLKGLAAEMKASYQEALMYYLKTLDAARLLNERAYIVTAYSDLAILYASRLKQPQQAKEMYKEALQVEEQAGRHQLNLSTYVNLGAIYNQLNMPDSALYFLNQGMQQAKEQQFDGDLATLNNNFGNAWFSKKIFSKAQTYFRKNYDLHLQRGDRGQLWYDVLNMADVFIEMRRFDSAAIYLDKSARLAAELSSESREADVNALYTKYYAALGNYKKAYEAQRDWYRLDTSLLNSETANRIAELQEVYNAHEREAENKLLQTQVEKERLNVKYITFLAISLGFIVLSIAWAFMVKRQTNKRLKSTNELIMRQNQRLAELNHEKNSLISIVSHDLSTPFATIQMWAQVLEADQDELNQQSSRAVGKILQASEYGEKLIRHILDVEKSDTGKHTIELDNFDLKIFIEDIVDELRPVANKKDIAIHAETPSQSLYVLSDRQLVNRICTNLLTNAIKYTPQGKNVWVSVAEEKNAVNIKVRDEGVGIEPDELPHLFSKYSKISSQPTAGENSTGLGLSIVKRIVEELNGKIYCESEPGKGSLFTVVLKK